MAQVTKAAENIYQIKVASEDASTFYGPASYFTGWFLPGPSATLIEPGPTSAARVMLEEIEKLGHDPKEIEIIIATHVHVDHAGGMGWLAQELPRARLIIHEKGARHLLDPSRLIASTAQVFGEEWEEIFGPILPVPQERLSVVKDGEAINLAGRTHRILYTPGHAPHHASFYDPSTGILYGGEAVGMPLPGTEVMSPHAAPPFYDMEAALNSLEKVDSLKPHTLFYSHYGASDKEPRGALEGARESVQKFGQIIYEAFEAEEGVKQICRRLREYCYGRGEAPPEYSDGMMTMAVEGYVAFFHRKRSQP